MLRKKVGGVARGPRLSSSLAAISQSAVNRRDFLKNSGLTVGGLAAIGALNTGTATKAVAASAGKDKVDIVKSVCTHCSVGCTVLAEVSTGVWIGQEPGFNSPFNLGAHCAKGASVREHAHGERRLKYPTKLVGGKWQRISWDDAINEIGDQMLKIREEFGAGFGLLARICQTQQRTGLSGSQVRRLLGLEQRRSPGPYLSLDHGRRCCQHLGLWCDDELV